MSQTYAELIAEFPLRPIRSDRMADRAGRLAFQLAARRRLGRDESDYLTVLTSLIEAYEDERHPRPVQDSPRELLRFLIDENGLTLSHLAAETEISVSTLSEILSGKREFALPHVHKLCRWLCCEPGVWIRPSHAVAG